MNQNEVASSAREAAIKSLAVVGFIALVGAGIWLAIYSTRFVPAAVDRIGAAAVYLGAIFTRDNDLGLTVVPTPSATTTIPFGNATTTATSTPTTQPGGAPTAGPQTNTTVQITGTMGAPANLHGLPDLTIRVTAVGYLTTASPDSFVESSTVPRGERPAVKFSVTNIGTNSTGAWRFEAELPTRRSFTYRSPSQQALLPGESIEYTLGFDQPDRGDDQEITIRLDQDDAVNESSENNNNASATVDVN